ncbi:MAG: hypothetical protein CMO81_00910 [Waddliaceae bacterium]|nr:hypothetical protein [Waddliaceae bacterium]
MLSNRFIYTITLIATVSILTLGAFAVYRTMSIPGLIQRISTKEVKAVEFVLNDTPYPLSFEQQQHFINLLNYLDEVNERSLPSLVTSDSPPELFRVYLFSKEEFIVNILGKSDDYLVFRIEKWGKNQLYREREGMDFRTFIEGMHD